MMTGGALPLYVRRVQAPVTSLFAGMAGPAESPHAASVATRRTVAIRLMLALPRMVDGCAPLSLQRPPWPASLQPRLRPCPFVKRSIKSTVRRRVSEAGFEPTTRIAVLERCDDDA